DLDLRQGLAQFLLCFGRNDRAAPAEDVDDRRLDLAHEAPQLGWHETIPDFGIPLPDDAAIGARPGAVVRVCSKNIVRGTGIRGFELCEQFVFGCPALFVFLLYTVGQASGDLSRPLGADILANHCSGEVRMQAREYLCDAAACRISPNKDVSKLELLRHAFYVLDVVFDTIRA